MEVPRTDGHRLRRQSRLFPGKATSVQRWRPYSLPGARRSTLPPTLNARSTRSSSPRLSSSGAGFEIDHRRADSRLRTTAHRQPMGRRNPHQRDRSARPRPTRPGPQHRGPHPTNERSSNSFAVGGSICAPSSASARSSPPPLCARGRTRAGSATRRRSRCSQAPQRSQPHRGRPSPTGSAARATAGSTRRSTPSCSPASATTPPHAPTPNGGAPKARPTARSSAALKRYVARQLFRLLEHDPTGLDRP